MLKQISVKWVARQAALGLKGAKADVACYEFMVGAATALSCSGHPDADLVAAHIHTFGPFPCGEVKRWAEAA